jgi:TonB family protein
MYTAGFSVYIALTVMYLLTRVAILFAVPLACLAQPGSGARPVEGAALAQGSLLRGRIVRNLVVPASVPVGASAEVACEYSEDGSITSLMFIRSSGHPEYDEAVEAAIRKAAPFVLTPSIGSDGKPVREIVLSFRY